MSESAYPVPMVSAAQLWRRLVKEGVLRPRSYDGNVVTILGSQLPGIGDLPQRMDAAGWTPRDLLRAMLPIMDSFAGLLRDLLALYSNIAASHATKESLTLAYEFDEGDVFDVSLEQFRSSVNALDQAQAARGTFIYSAQRFSYPSLMKHSVDNSQAHMMRDDGEHEWKFTLPAPPESRNPVVARGVSLVYAVLSAACDTLKNYGATMDLVRRNTDLRKEEEHRRLYYDFTDYFPEHIILQLQHDVDTLRLSSATETRNWLCGIEHWCSTFWRTEAHDAESALESVLSLPMWGKRHELYSAWVVCLIAEAFNGQQLEFRVVNGSLSFPFKATKIASFVDRSGPVELWAELRSDASGDLAQGRKKGVQPDYRFIRPNQAPGDTEMAIEVKQYRRAAAARHGDTARDYARALPQARVAVVAHGPIGRTAIERVDSRDTARVFFRENVRSTHSAEARAFVGELTKIFPPAAHVQDIEVVQFCLKEYEIEVIAEQRGQRDSVATFNHKRTASIEPTSRSDIILTIVCHPERQHTIDEAHPRIALIFSSGEVRLFQAAQPIRSKSWNVGTVLAGSFVMSSETVEITGLS